MSRAYAEDNKYRGIPLVGEDAREYLNPRQEVAYREHRGELAEWLFTFGKNPEKVEGYSASTVQARMYHLDLFYRWVWDQEGRYIQDLTTDHADAWMRYLATEEFKELITGRQDAMSDINHTIEDLFGEGDRVVVRGRVTARHTGEMLGVPATNRDISVTETIVYRLQNGAIAETWAAVDRLGLLEQIGAVDPPAP